MYVSADADDGARSFPCTWIVQYEVMRSVREEWRRGDEKVKVCEAVEGV